MKNHVKVYKALGDETRLRILALLLAEGELCVCYLMAALNLPQSTISRHLAHLRDAGWVNDRRCGLWIYYSIVETDAAKMQLIPVLKYQLLQTERSLADRRTLADLSGGNRCA